MTATAQKNFSAIAKPSGARCNLGCDYCFFLKKDKLYPESNFKMPDEVHDAYIRQILEAQDSTTATIAWQGGEPTLMGLDFYRHSIELQKKYKKPDQQIENTFQTNGILIDDQWCKFFRENNFLVGLSIDGPADLHDHYRKDKAGNPTSGNVLQSVKLLQEYGVEFNILCTVNSVNSMHPLKVYRFFRDELKSRYIQFIPIVEWKSDEEYRKDNSLTKRSVSPEQFGRFLSEIFSEWITRDVGEMFVLNFDSILAGWLGLSGACIFSKTCGLGPAVEHNGDVYSCDHYVEPDHLLGNIIETHLIDLVSSTKQQKFGMNKKDNLPQACKDCNFLFLCNGECPKNRFSSSAQGKEAGTNYLCSGYKMFFRHSEKPMRIMAELIRLRQPASAVMSILSKDRDRLYSFGRR